MAQRFFVLLSFLENNHLLSWQSSTHFYYPFIYFIVYLILQCKIHIPARVCTLPQVQALQMGSLVG